jgi:peptidoglycan/xylan/chitin deacetylase (PgdA/CDA1 family)
MTHEPLESFSAYLAAHTNYQLWRRQARDTTIFLLSCLSRVPTNAHWIRFPYYHHVFDDEQAGFISHLRYMQNLGDIISLDDAVEILESNAPIQGRYFCITFDDGFKNCATNAVPILLDHQATAAFFLPTSYIGRSVDGPLAFCRPLQIAMEFLTWDDCRQMIRSGMSLGSHTVSHPQLIDLSDDEVERELRESKEHMERELNVPCEHFCCPTGRPGIDFRVERSPEIARQLGSRSFLTTRRGSSQRKSVPMMIERDHTIADWSNYQLRYFFSR